MAHPFWQVRQQVDAILRKHKVEFHDFNDGGFEQSLRERKAPRRAYGMPELLADVEREFGLPSGKLAPLGKRQWLWLHDLLHAVANDGAAKVAAAAAPNAKAKRAAAAAFDAALERYSDGDPHGAAEKCEEACAAAPNADAHSLRALLHYDAWQERHIDATNLDLAHVELDTALSLGADDPNTWQRAGHIFRAREQYDAAEAAYKRVLSAVGDDGISLYYNLGLLYEDAGRVADAISAYETFVDGAGEDYAEAVGEAKKKLSKLRKAKKSPK